MNADSRTDPAATASSPETARPQLRTVVLADIVDSTALVERLGDRAAAELLHEHDGLLLQLLKLCHGQLIDRADGALTLFERPIDALDFALRYQQGLGKLGEGHRIALRARIGVHVGEVLVWHNSPEAVAAGAKPVEIEGLAKPVAARLMSLALPGQILLSGMAQSLAHRALGELGERGRTLRWLMHGRYGFKGVSTPMLVHEVGDPAFAPLKPPPSTAKAWRELPFWRRPMVLAVEAIAAVGLALFGLWGLLRPEPALAFRERDWVVVGDLQNLTGDARFEDALDAAFRIGLEQSRYVNVMSDLQVRDTLQRMQRDGSRIDRQLGVEIAQREGARALVLPSVSEIGGRVRFAVEVIDPGTGATVYSEVADAQGADAILDTMDKVLEELRGKLGESVEAIQSTSLPLEQVTTSNLEALKAYSLAIEALANRDARQAYSLLRRAVELDPQFSMAHAKLAGFAYLADDMPLMRQHLLLARENPDRLIPRERLYLQAFEAVLQSPEQALERWTQLANLYPDFMTGQQNAANILWFHYNDFEGAARWYAQVASSRHPLRGMSLQLWGVMLLGQEESSLALLRHTEAAAINTTSLYDAEADVYLARRDYRNALAAMSADLSRDAPQQLIWKGLRRIAWHVDQAQYAEALGQIDVLARNPAVQPVPGNAARLTLARLQILSETDPARFRAELPGFLQAQRARVAGIGTSYDSSSVAHLLAGALLAARGGVYDGLPQILEETRALSIGSGFYDRTILWNALAAELALHEGREQAARDAIVALADPHALIAGRYTRLRVLHRYGPADEARAAASGLCAARGQAISEWGYGFSWLVPNLMNVNRACLLDEQVAVSAPAVPTSD